jgi:hypothetical protein
MTLKNRQLNKISNSLHYFNKRISRCDIEQPNNEKEEIWNPNIGSLSEKFGSNEMNEKFAFLLFLREHNILFKIASNQKSNIKQFYFPHVDQK